MKKLSKIILALTIFTVMAVSVGCSNKTDDKDNATSSNTDVSQSTETIEKTTVNIAVLKGPTGMGAAKLMAENEDGNGLNDYNFTIAAAPDEITGKIISGEIDIAAVPTNLGATLYNKTEGGVNMLALNTLGVLHLVENGTENITSIEDLAGKKIYATGQGATPEYVLNFILEQKGLEDVEIEYMQEHAELMTALVSGEVALGILPEPNVTTALSKNTDLKIALDLTEEWEKACQGTDYEGSVLSMGAVVVRKDFAEENKEAVDKFLEEYKASIDFTNTNIDEAAELIAKYEIIPSAELAAKAIPNCNIVFIDGEDMKNSINDFFKVLNDANPKSIGGSVPNENFYYTK